MGTSKSESSTKLRRLMRDSIVKMDERTETLWLGAHFSKCVLTNIRDTNWQHDLVKIFEKVFRLDKKKLRCYLLFY